MLDIKLIREEPELVKQRLATRGPRITRLAYGLPAGAGLEFADELTLSRALEGRRELR